MKLNKLQEAWLSALETGVIGDTKYKKTMNTLCHLKQNGEPEGFCCLGVACEIYNAAVPKKDKLPIVKDRTETTRGYGKSFGHLPGVVKEALNLRSAGGAIVKANLSHKCLADLNDEGWSHRRIAKFIRANPEKVFKV